MWFLEQLESLGATYNELLAIRIRGPVDVAVLRASVAAVVERHAVLRTRIETRADGRPVQRRGPAPTVPAPVDLSTVAETTPETALTAWLAREGQRPFVLAEGVCRFGLARLGPDDHVLLVTAHHTAWDGWSQVVFMREVRALYAAQAAGAPSPLAPLPVQYADYAQWQRAWLVGERVARQLAYWRTQLAAVPTLELPTDQPRPRVPSYRGARCEFTVDPGLSAAVAALSRREGVTLYMVLLAAFQVQMGRWSGQDDLAVGSPIAGRTVRETEDLIGMFINTVVLRGDLRGAPSFRTVLQRVRRVALEAYTHQDVPFEQVVGVLAPTHDLARQALFQVMFILQTPSTTRSADPAGLTCTWVPVTGTTAKFDVTLELVETQRRPDRSCRT